MAARRLALAVLLRFGALVLAQDDQTETGITWWKPTPGTSWQWQLSSEVQAPGSIPVDTSFDVHVYDVDLFFTSLEDIDTLHSLGRTVICYFSAGTWEPWRWDAMGFPDTSLGRKLDLWEGEKFLDVRNISSLAPTIESRLNLAVAKHCDAVEPDNVDAYMLSSNQTGFDITEEDQVVFLKYLSEEAHKRGLSIGLKNNLGLVNTLVDWFDFAISESCNTYGDTQYNCSNLLPFIKANKAVFGVEYYDNEYVPFGIEYIPQFCDAMNEAGYSWIVKSMLLTPKPYYSCNTNVMIRDDPPYHGLLSPPPPDYKAIGPSPKQATYQGAASSVRGNGALGTLHAVFFAAYAILMYLL